MKLSPIQLLPRRAAAFTLVEIAISLAVIAFALVAIIGVLPSGMTVQRENREETIINQDASVFIDAIRNGARGLDDLTNYVMGITITTTQLDSEWLPVSPGVTWSYVTRSNPPPFALPADLSPVELTNGRGIIGLLGTPKFRPGTAPRGFESNHVAAYVRALSGIATEKSPQINADVRADAFAYRVICENLKTPLYVDPVPPPPGSPNFAEQLTNNLRELRLTFRWPLNPKGESGNGRQTFRTVVGGSPEQRDSDGLSLHFFRPANFEKAQP